MATAISENDAPSIGHNNPPEPTLPERLAETYGAEVAKVDHLAKRADCVPKEIATNVDRDEAANIARDAGALAKSLDKLREVEKAPHLKAGRDVDGYFNPVVNRLDRISKILLGRISDFNRAQAAKAAREKAEAERIERERAEEARKAAEAAARAGRVDDAVEEMKDAAAFEERAASIAAAPTIDRDEFKATTDAGTAIGTRRVWTFEVADYSKIDLNALRGSFKRDVIDAALRQHVRTYKDGAPVAGVRFFEDEKATVR